MAQAALILFLCDQSVPFTREDGQRLEQAMELAPTILVWNKCDLPSAPVPVLHLPEELPVVEISAKTGAGLEELERAVAARIPQGSGEACGELLTNARQAEAVGRALSAVAAAREALDFGMTPDAVLTDAEHALEALGELTGKSIREDLVATIFSRFCVGK
jgi:tRNA modification GTPase